MPEDESLMIRFNQHKINTRHCKGNQITGIKGVAEGHGCARALGVPLGKQCASGVEGSAPSEWSLSDLLCGMGSWLNPCGSVKCRLFQQATDSPLCCWLSLSYSSPLIHGHQKM